MDSLSKKSNESRRHHSCHFCKRKIKYIKAHLAKSYGKNGHRGRANQTKAEFVAAEMSVMKQREKVFLNNQIISAKEINTWFTENYSVKKLTNLFIKKGFLIKDDLDEDVSNEIDETLKEESKAFFESDDEEIFVERQDDPAHSARINLVEPTDEMESDEDLEEDASNAGMSTRNNLKNSGLDKACKKHRIFQDFVRKMSVNGGYNKSNLRNAAKIIRRLFHYLGRKLNLQKPYELNLEALTKHPVYINDWLYDLSTIGKISYNTKMNYIKAILIFVKYLRTFQHVDDTVKFNTVLDLIVSTVEITKLGTFKQILKEQKKKQFEASINDTQVDLGFVEIFTGDAFIVWKNRVRHKLDKDMLLSKNDETFVTRLCMGMIVIKYFQRPGVAANLTTKEYSSQRHKNSVSVYKHKTSGIRPAYFPLSADDRYWFDVYLTKIRPKRARIRPKSKEQSLFFLNRKGKKFLNVSNEIERFQLSDLKMTNSYSSTDVRKSIERLGATKLSSEQKAILNKYMQHSVGCALKIYQNITEDEVKAAGQITNDLINEAFAEYREILTNPPFYNDADNKEENFSGEALIPLSVEKDKEPDKIMQDLNLFDYMPYSVSASLTKFKEIYLGDEQRDLIQLHSIQFNSQLDNESNGIPSDQPQKRVDLISSAFDGENETIIKNDFIKQSSNIENRSATLAVTVIETDQIVDDFHSNERRQNSPGRQSPPSLEDVCSKNYVAIRVSSNRFEFEETNLSNSQQGLFSVLRQQPEECVNVVSKMAGHGSIQAQFRRLNMRSSNPVVFRPMLPEDLLADFIFKQNWPGIEIKFVNTKIGDGLFATENILRGDTVCDYAGNLMTAEEMEQFLSTCTPEQQTLIGRYRLDFIYKRKKYAIDASKPTNPTSYGRIVNHCQHHHNLQPKAKIINKELRVILEARKNILAGSQFLFDYQRLYERFDGFQVCPCINLSYICVA